MSVHTLESNSATIHYTRSGSGPVRLLIHGFLEDLHMWDDLLEHIPGSKICIDLPGHGNSSLTHEASIESMAKACIDVIKHENMEQVEIIGHSMGGYVSCEILRLIPDKVQSITFFHSTSRADSHEKKKNRDRAIELVNKDRNIFLKNTISGLFRNPEKHTVSIEEHTEQASTMDKKSIAYALTAMKNRKDSMALLAAASCPKHFYLGRFDQVLPIDAMLEEVDELKANSCVVDEESAHMGHIENFDAVLSYFKRRFQ